MSAVDTAKRETSTVALPGLGRALILAGKLGQKSAEDIYRKASSGRTSFIAELTGSGAVSASDLAHTMSTAYAAPLIDLDALEGNLVAGQQLHDSGRGAWLDQESGSGAVIR